VAASDAALAPLLQPVLAGTGERSTLVVLTSDHGESLGEHGEATHGIFAYDSTLRVPLILHLQQAGRGRVVTDPAQHTDVLPTILDALGLDVPPGLDGESLLPQIDGRPRAGVTSYFEALSGTLNRGWAPLRGILRDRFKYVDLPLPELYDLAADPREERNLAETQPDRVREMRSLLASARVREVGLGRRSESADARSRLGSLGYVAGAGDVDRHYTDADDPKRLITLDATLQEIVSLYARRDLDAAVARCRDLIRKRPSMGVSLLYLAQLERERGDLPAAIDALRRALALNPGDTTSAALLGAYLTQAGRPDEALRVLSSHEGLEEDEQAIVARALALASLRRFAEALDLLDRARQQDPASAKVLIEIGTVHLMAGQTAQAQHAFERAVQINPEAARAHSSLGAIAAERGNLGAAVRHWQRAVELDPREHGKLFALGVALARAGRQGAARSYLEFFVASAPAADHAADIARARQWLSKARR
jgi:tetratricopeptide (TPR) repeat protein